MRIRSALLVMTIVATATAVYGQSRTQTYGFPGQVSPPGESGMDSDERLEALAELWRAADSDGDKTRIKEMASDALSAEFDADMERREAELEAIEARVDQLRSQLDRRSSSKDEILEVQLKQITMAWEGLGWRSAEDSDHNRFSWMPKHPNLAVARAGRLMLHDNDEDSSITTLILDAVAREDDNAVEFLAEKLVSQLSGMSPEGANTVLWTLWEETAETVENKAYWRALTEAGEDALERYGDDDEAANTWDTVAHLYDELGEVEKALEYQKKAVELSGGNSDLTEFLRTLKQRAEK